MAKLPIEFILPLMEKIGLAKKQGTGYNPISKTAFGKLGDFVRYSGGSAGKRGIYIIYFGDYRSNCFGFYPPRGNKQESLEIAYSYYLDCFTEMKQEYIDGNVCWGNWGRPISYNIIRVHEPSMLELIKELNPEPQPWTFNLGSASVETVYLSELREVVEEIKTGNLSNKVTDFIFAVETAYQKYYELDENNFEIVHN